MRSFADALIEQYPEALAGTLPAGLETEERIVAWLSSMRAPDWAGQGERWQMFECYRYKGYLFLTIKTGSDQKRGAPANLGTGFIINLRQRTGTIILLGRS